MSERKLKCTRCGKWFKAADYTHTLCPKCLLAERTRRPAAAGTPLRRSEAATGVGVVDRARANSAARGSAAAGSSAAAPAGLAQSPASAATAVQVPPVSTEAAARRARQELTPEQRQVIERRYLELATPQEYDGIRGQIAGELKLPRTLVKKAVNDVRQRLGRPSWWELQQNGVPLEVVEAVKERYVPLLPVPPIGIHRQLAEDLGFSPLHVYRAIGQIRTELGLPKFNERPEVAPEPVATPAL